MNAFSLSTETLDLPGGAFARGYRRLVRYRGKPVVGFTQGPHRSYLYPVYSPQGYLLTSESPADHPHHNSVWVAADHVHCLFPTGGARRYEEGTYCFYVNETFQGRAAGRIEETECRAEEGGEDLLQVVQRLRWQGPVEWGSAEGKCILSETRTTSVQVTESLYRIEIRSRIEPTDWDLRIGPTRHAYFGVRVSESMQVKEGGRVVASDGCSDVRRISGSLAEWIDYSGPVGGGHRAGITIVPGIDPAAGEWFVTDWGTVAINPFLNSSPTLAAGDALECRLLLLLHDGEGAPESVPARI